MEGHETLREYGDGKFILLRKGMTLEEFKGKLNYPEIAFSLANAERAMGAGNIEILEKEIGNLTAYNSRLKYDERGDDSLIFGDYFKYLRQNAVLKKARELNEEIYKLREYHKAHNLDINFEFWIK